MNSDLSKKIIHLSNGESPNFQALKQRQSEYGSPTTSLEIEIEDKIKREELKSEKEKDIKKTAGFDNQYQDKLNPTAVNSPKVTKSSDHSGGVNSKIMSQNQILPKNSKILTKQNEEISKEISNIRYLIEYMNNDNKLNL